MSPWRMLLWMLIVASVPFVLYALHRLALWMEERGYLYYMYKKPKGGTGGAFLGLQQIIEPQVQHVIQAARVNHLAGDEEASGQGSDTRSQINATDGIDEAP
jgi:hypothetical protein